MLLVVGEKERTNLTVNVRTRDNKVHGEFSLDAVIDRFNHLREERVLKSEEYGWRTEEDEGEVSQGFNFKEGGGRRSVGFLMYIPGKCPEDYKISCGENIGWFGSNAKIIGDES